MRHTWGEDRVYFHDGEGRFCAMPRAWTSLAAIDEWLQVASGRSLLRLADCLALVSWVQDVTI